MRGSSHTASHPREADICRQRSLSDWHDDLPDYAQDHPLVLALMHYPIQPELREDEPFIRDLADELARISMSPEYATAPPSA